MALNPSHLEVINESHRHAGHAGVAGNSTGETHFKIVISSELLAGLAKVQQHRMIYAALDDLMNNPIHALSIEVKD